jgi:hypothetical protein
MSIHRPVYWTFRNGKAFNMDLKIVHISRNQLDRKEADARALWENVLKPKWEKRSRARAEGLVTKLPGDGKMFFPEFTAQQEVQKSVEKIEISIEVSGNNLSIRWGKSNGEKQ